MGNRQACAAFYIVGYNIFYYICTDYIFDFILICIEFISLIVR